MEIIKYEREDVFPVVLTVLDFMAFYFVSIILKFVLKDHHPDLQGKVDTRNIEASQLQLIDEVDDVDIAMMRYMYVDIHAAIDSILNLQFSGGVLAEPAQERTVNLAEDLYWTTIMNGFPLDHEVDPYDDQDYMLFLDLYLFSSISVVEQLIFLIETGGTDFEVSKSSRDIYYVYKREDYVDKEHAQVFEYLFNLIDQLHSYKKFFLRNNTHPALD